MRTLYDLYLQNPFWIWMALGAVFVALEVATGRGKLIWPAMGAAAAAFINLATARRSPFAEIGVFILFCGLGIAFTVRPRRRRPQGSPANVVLERTTAPTLDISDPASKDRTGRLIGRIGRPTGEFVNGGGRVWIDGAEWGAEIDAGEEVLPPDTPVRVMGVTGGVRLQVRGLMG